MESIFASLQASPGQGAYLKTKLISGAGYCFCSSMPLPTWTCKQGKPVHARCEMRRNSVHDAPDPDPAVTSVPCAGFFDVVRLV